jgi:SulP family sulfate permease
MVTYALSILRQSGYLLVPRVPFYRAYAGAEGVRDLVAGVTVAAVLIPQSIAYALLAGLPPVHGLYAALIGGVAGSLWGSSKFLATGPIAIVSLLTLTAISPIAIPGSSEFIVLVAALAVMIGIIQIAIGLFRLGFLVRLVPDSVLAGFQSGAAVLIILTQIPNLLGFASGDGTFVFQQIGNIATHIFDLNILTTFLGIAALLFLTLTRTVRKSIPVPLIVLATSIAASYLFDLQSYGIAIAGDISARLPILDVPSLSAREIAGLGGDALVIAAVGFISSYAVVKDIAKKTGERINADKELVGQGFANMLTGLFRGGPVGGSLSRTAVNYEAGAATQWSGVFASMVVLATILFLSPAFAYLPKAVLAALVIAAVMPLIDLKNLRRMYAITHTDGIIGIVTFSAVFILRPDEAVLTGILLALGMYLRKVMWVHVVEVGVHPRWHSLYALSSYPHAKVYPRMLMLRVDAPIFFANAERLGLEVKMRLEECERRRGERIKIIVLDFSGVNHMDVTGIDGFAELVLDLKKRGIKLYVATPRHEIRRILERGHLAENIRLIHDAREVETLGESLGHDEQHKPRA